VSGGRIYVYFKDDTAVFPFAVNASMGDKYDIGAANLIVNTWNCL